MRHATKTLATFLLTLAMVVGLMPGMSLTAYAAEETITINCQNDTLSAHGITNKLGANGTHGDFNDWGWIAWGQFIAPSGKVFTKIEVYGKEYEYDDETKKVWEWSGRAKIVSHDNFIDCDPYTSYIFTLDDAAPISQTVTFKVVNGSWDDGTTADKTVTLSGYEYDTLKLAAGDIPTVGTKPGNAYKAGSWDVTPSANTAITAATTYTYTYASKEAAVVTKAPEGKTLTYNGQERALVTAGEATGGEMQYALGTDATTAPETGYSASIPTATDAGTYYVWYKAKGNDSHLDTQPKCIEVTINPTDYSASVSNKALSFTGQPQPLVNAGTVSGGTLQYALGTDANTAPTDGWSTEIPTAIEPGTYYVWYKVVGDENHNDVAPACVVVTIEAPAAAPAAPESVSDYTLLASMKTSGNKAFKLKWTAVSGAEGYDVFFGRVGKKAGLKTSVNGTSCKIKKLKRGIAYKAFVKAWKTENGQKVYIGQASPEVYAITGGRNNRYTNPKKITVKKKNLTVAVGGSKKIKASLKKFSNSRRYLNHTAKIRYFSSNRAVATVNAKGKVTGVAPGTCTVYAVAENGLRKGVKITVK